jgi:hypothetical protein
MDKCLDNTDKIQYLCENLAHDCKDETKIHASFL